MFKEFKEFAVKGNVVDMAVGIMIGAAFTSVVDALVKNILMPPIGMVMGGLDFTNRFWVLEEGAKAGPYGTLAEAESAGATVLSYGTFINSLVSFMIVGLVLFFIVRWINRLRSPETPAAPSTKPCSYCMQSVHEKATRCPHCTSELS